MMKWCFIVLYSCIYNCAAYGQHKTIQSFIPKGYTVLDSAYGDLNGDGNKDLVLILKSPFEHMNGDTTRPLLLLQGNGVDKYKLIGRNDYVVLCANCGGVFGDPYQGITIKNKFFSIEHYGGSGWHWTRIITFKFVAGKRFVLHRDAGDSWHSSNPDKPTENIFNKADFGKLLFEKYNYAKGW